MGAELVSLAGTAAGSYVGNLMKGAGYSAGAYLDPGSTPSENNPAAGVINAGAQRAINVLNAQVGGANGLLQSTYNNQINPLFKTAQSQLSPYANQAQNALSQLQKLLGLGGDAQSEQQALSQTPGYQFALQQGTQNVQNSAAANGMLNSGATLQAIDQYTTGLADQTYQNAINNGIGFLNTITPAVTASSNLYGQQAGIAGQFGIQGANNLVQLGENTASIDMAQAAAIAGLLSGNSFMGMGSQAGQQGGQSYSQGLLGGMI